MPWLTQPDAWRDLTAEAESRDPNSMLSLYRSALHLRRTHPAFRTDAFRWLPSPAGTLLFACGAGMRCAVNLSVEPMPLPSGRISVLASVTLLADVLPRDAATWFEMDRG